MKLSDVEVGGQYIVGPRREILSGVYSSAQLAYVLDIGKYIEVRGECGWIVQATDKSVPRRCVVMTTDTSRWLRRQYGTDEGIIVPRVVEARQFVMTKDELDERLAIIEKDQKRHEAERRARQNHRRQLLRTIEKDLRRIKCPMPSIYQDEKWNSDKGLYDTVTRVEFSEEQFVKLLKTNAKAAAEAFQTYASLRDPRC